MPNLDYVSSDSDDEEPDIQHTERLDAKQQLNGELEDKVVEVKGKVGWRKPKAEVMEEVGEEAGDVEDEEEGDEGEEGEEGEDVVEAIRGHKIKNGKVHYIIKWAGWEDEANTTEPIEHLLPGAKDILAEYHKQIGGEPTKAGAGGPKKRKPNTSFKDDNVESDTPLTKRSKRDSNDTGYRPTSKNWDAEIAMIETVEQADNDKLMAYIKFTNGKATKVGMDMVYKHCPIPMLKFYEDHLRFT